MSWTQQDTSFKKLQSKRITTSTGKGINEEKGASTLELYLPDIKTEIIPGTPPGASTSILAYTGGTGQTLVVDTSVPGNLTWFATSGYGNTTVANNGTQSSEEARLMGWISDKYDAFGTISGAGYEVKLYDANSNLITKTDPSDWLFDYQTGILTFNNANTAFGAVATSGPYRIVGYRYIGKKGIITAAYGGLGFTNYNFGDILVGAGTSFIKLPLGTNNYILSASSSSAIGLSWIPNTGGVGAGSQFSIPYYTSAGSAITGSIYFTNSGTGISIAYPAASTSTSSGALTVVGGVGIGGTLNVNNIGIGYTGIPYNPSIAFIGTTGDPIRLSVLANNTLSFEGSSGQLFSINNNLSSGWIFSVNDISGIPLFRANANANIAMAEYAGNVGIGLSNATFKLQVAGSASIGDTLFVNRLKVNSKITFEPGTGTSAVSGWSGIGLTSISKMIYGGGRFVGVGGSYVAYSTDGVNFTYTTIPGSSSTDTYGDIAYGNNVYVAVNAQNVGFTAYSYDGASWGRTSIATGIHRTIGFGNGRFLTIAEAGGNSYTSTDGRNWSTVGNVGGYGREIIFANGYFLSPRSTNLYYSKDGASWKVANTPGSNMIHGVAYGKGLYIAADYNTAQYFTSPDLNTWTLRPIDNKVWTGASYNNGVFYLIPNNNNFLHHSLDGINWSTTNFGTPIGGTPKFFTANDRLYFFSSYGPTLWSTDATTGTLMVKPFYNGELENTRIGAVNPDSATFTHLTALNDVSFTSATASTGSDNGALTVSGGVGIAGTTNLNTLRVNQDLVFTPTTGTTALAGGLLTATLPAIPGAPGYIRIRAVTFGNGRFVGGASTSIIWSDDAINWNRVNTPFTTGTNIQAIAYGNGTWIASTTTSTELIYSLNNGVTWNLTTIPNANVTDAVYGNGIFIISSGQYSGISTNGISWSTYSSIAYPHSFINGYFYSNTHRSADGLNWQAFNIPVPKISYGNGLYFGAEYNSANYYISYDGVNFTTTTIGNAVHVNSAYYNGVYYLLTQHNNQILKYSTDGFNYTNVYYPNGSTNYGMAAGNNKIVLFNTLYTDITNYIYYAEASFGKANIQPFREGTIDNVTIGSRIPQAGTFNNVSVLKNLNVNSSFPSVSSNTGAFTVLGGVGIGASVNIGGRIGIGTNLLTSSFNLLTPTSSTIGAFIQGRSSQTADLINTANSSGTINFSVGANGNVLINLTSGSSKGLIIKANASQSVNLLELQNSSSSPLTTFDQLGNLNISSSTASTSFDNGALTVTGGVGIGGTLNVGSARVVRNFTHTPTQTTIGGATGWVANITPAGLNVGTVKYLNNKFVGIGGTYIYYSDDAITWSSVMVPNLDVTRAIGDVTYGEGKYVLVQYYTSNAGFSTNLTNWTVGATLVYQTWSHVEYGNGRFVAANGGGAYASSLDGASWTGVNDPLGYSVALNFINGYFYSTNSNSISRSIDGLSWQACNTPAIPNGLAYGNGLYVGGVYNSGTIVYSYDGLNFSSYSGSSFVHNNSWFYNGVYYLTTNNNQVIRYSTDGFNWSNSTGFPSAVLNLRYAQGRLWAGSGNTLWSAEATPGKFEVNPLRTGNLDDVEIGRLSPNNANFIDVSVNNNLNVSSQYDSASILNGALTVAGGVGIGKTLNTNSARVFNNFNHTPSTGSTGGIAWTSVSYPTIPGLSGNGFDNCVIYGGDKFVGIAGTNVYYSYDSYNWFYSPIPSSTNARAITYGNGVYIAINNTGSVAHYSYNGISWSTSTLPNSTTNGDKACFGNGKFVYNDGSGNVGISTNGINWTLKLVLSGGAYPYGVDYANGLYFARWQNNYFRSADLNTWTRFTLPADSSRSKILFSKNKYYAPNNNASNYFVSDDGFNWTTQAVASGLWINMYDYFGTLYLIRSSANAVSYSEDGINWATASLGGTSNTNATGLVYGNGRFVYVGSSPNLIFSGNAPNGVSHISTPRTSEIDNVRIGANSPASAQFTGLNANGSVNFTSTSDSNSLYNGALTVAGGVGIGGSLYSGSIFTAGRLQNQSFSGAAIATTGFPTTNKVGGHDSFSYGNGVFVSNSSWGAYNASYSTDGINWISTSLPVNQGYPVNFYGNGYFVLAASGSTTVLYSTNGSSWSQVSIGNTNTRSRGVYGNGKYLIFGGSGQTQYNYSSNVTSWSTGTLPLDGDWRVAYGNGVFVALGYGSRKLIYSYDGINWSIGTLINNTNYTKLTYGNGKFVAANMSGWASIYSFNGIDWFSTSSPSGLSGNQVGAEYGNGTYVISDDNQAYTFSTDGIIWNTALSTGGSFDMGTPTYGLNKFNMFGRYVDGPTNTVTIDPKFTGEINNVRIGAVTPSSGDFTNLSSTGSANLVGTVNANNLNVISRINQTPVLGGYAGTTGWTSANIMGGSSRGMAFGNGIFVSTRIASNVANFSSDGKRWISTTLPFSGDWKDVAWGNDKFVAVSSSGTTAAYSSNGISWESMNMPSSTSGWYAITYGDDKFVAVSSSGTTAAYSSDGITWTGSAIANTNWTGITYGSGTFVAVAGVGRSVTYSYDGINWNLANLPNDGSSVKFITYGNGYFVVTGHGAAISYSRDGINWSSTTRSSSSNLHYGIEYGNGVYNTLNYAEVSFSYDAVNWINSNNIQFNDWFSVAYGNGKFVGASSYDGHVSYNDGPSNTLNLHPKFTGDIDNVRIGAKQPGAAEFTNLAAQQPVRFTANTPSTNATSGALVVLGGVGIGGTINASGRLNIGTLAAPSMNTLSGFGTGGLTPSTTYYYRLSAVDYNGNESLPSPELSTTLSASQYGTRFFISPSSGAMLYRLYRTTTSGSYANSFVQTYRVNHSSSFFYYDVGKATSAGSPLSVSSANSVTLGVTDQVPSNILPSLTIPNGTLQVKSPNFIGFASPGGATAAIETGTSDFVAIRDPSNGYGGVSASTGGSLTPGQTYYYVATIVDHYGNESLPTQELAFTADAGGAAIIGFNVLSVQVSAFRIYRTTTPGNYTNSYLGELPGNKDIGYPTMSGSPPTTTNFAGIRLNPRADFASMSYIPNIDIAPSHRNGMLRKLDVPYTGAIAVTTSGIAGSLLPNTTYYYKCSAFDIFGGAAYPTAEVSVSTGTSTAVTISGGSGILYAKVYRSTTKNNYINVPTYYVNSFPFTDRGDTTFTDTPSNTSNYIQSQLFWNQSNAVPQNYLRDLSIGPILNNFPFSILAVPVGLNSVTASTGGTLVEGQVYYYVMEAVDAYNFGSSSGQPIRFVATAGGAANVSQGIIGGYGYVSYNLYRTSNLASWANSLIAVGIKGNFIDIGYPGRSGSPNFSYQRARNVIFDNRGIFHIPQIANQFYGQNLTAPGAAFRTGGNSSGSLTTNTTYYYRVIPYGGSNQAPGFASDEFQYTTGANERSISWSMGGHKIGAMYYRVYRSTTFNNFTNAYYFETPHINFTDYGHTALQTTPEIGALGAPYANTVNLLNQANGNYLAYTFITGQSGGLKIHLKSPIISSISSGTGGTLSTNTDYWYKVEALDVYGIRTFASDEAYVNTGANNSVTLTWDDVPGAYYYRVFRATASQTFSNKLIASYVNARTFTDLNFPTTSATPVTIFENGQQGNTAALFQMDNAKFFGVMPRTIISNIDNTQSSWNTDFSLRITSPPVGSSSAALLQVGAGFTNFTSAGFNGSIYGTQIAVGAATGFSGSLFDAQLSGISRFRINFDGSATIGSTTGSGSTSTGALIVSGGVGIGGSLNVGSDVIINGGRESNSTSTGSLIVRGGVGITGGLYVKPFSLSTKGLVVQANTSQSGNLFELQSSASSTITSFNASGDLNITSSTANTSATTGSIVTAGGVGIGGSVSIGSTSVSTSTTNGALKVSGGVGIGGNVNVGGSLNFSTSTFGGVSTSITPAMTFIGQANDPITLSVLADNSLSFDGSSGQLFSINNNLSTGYIFSISDISGLPIFRTNADGTVSMGEFGGNVGIGLTNPSYKLQVAGNAGIANTLFVSGRAHIGNTSFTDIYGDSYNPIITATDNFDDDIVIQIENKSNGVNARAGLLFKNDSSSVVQLYLSGGNYGGAGLGFSEIRLLGDYPFVIETKNTTIRSSSNDIASFGQTSMTVIANAESTSSSTGSLVVTGGAGIGKSLNVAGFISSKPAYATVGLASNQTLSTGGDNLVLFTDNADPNGWWVGTAGSGVSHRFKPNIAGLYFVSAQIHFLQGTGSGQMNIQARKNGNTFSLSRSEVTTNASGLTLNLSGTVSLDGNTDYIDFTAYTAGTQNLYGEALRAWSHTTIYKIF